MQSYIFSHINTLPDADYSRFFCKIVSRNSTFIYVMQDKIDTYTHVVGPFDTDCSHRLSWNVLGTRILSAATSHARRRGFDTFEKDGVPYLWVLSRMVIEINRWPMVNETYQLTAPPTSRGRLRSSGMNMPRQNARAGIFRKLSTRAMTAPIP